MGTAENGKTVGLTFTFDNDVLNYDTGETTRRFAPGTIGGINDMNNVSAPVERITAEDDDNNELESCWGFYGTECLKELETECRHIIDGLNKAA